MRAAAVSGKANPSWEDLDVHLLRVLCTLLTESSVSRTARKLSMSQPAVSTALRRLRDITGDQLLIRSRLGMTPTERGGELLEHVRTALAQIERIATAPESFVPANSRRAFQLATADYLHAGVLGDLCTRLHRLAPNASVMVHSYGPDSDAAEALESGRLDAVIGNWPQPPQHLRMTMLYEDEMVCLVRRGHPLEQRRICAQDYLDAAHVAPTPYSVGQRGVIDVTLAKERLKRRVTAYVPYFQMAPYALPSTDLLFTAPRRFAEHYARELPLAVLPLPIDCPPMPCYLLWHDRTHYSDECRWFREQISAAVCSEDMLSSHRLSH